MVRHGLPVLLVALLGCPGHSCGRGGDAPELGWLLELGPRTGGAPAGSRGALLVANALDEESRARVAATLEGFAEQLERRRNPLAVDLDDRDERPAVDQLARDLMPAWTAAASLAAGRWSSNDGEMTVTISTTCSPGARCLPFRSGAPADAVEARARFLAWPLADGVVLRAPSSVAQATLVEALRRKRALPTRIALALPDRELHEIRPGAALGSLLESMRHLRSLLGEERSPFETLVERIAADPMQSDELSWLRLPARTVLVVPRLSALAELNAFVAEVRACAQGSPDAEWLYVPVR